MTREERRAVQIERRRAAAHRSGRAHWHARDAGDHATWTLCGLFHCPHLIVGDNTKVTCGHCLKALAR